MYIVRYQTLFKDLCAFVGFIIMPFLHSAWPWII